MRSAFLLSLLAALLLIGPAARAFTPFDAERLAERPVAAEGAARGVLFFGLAPEAGRALAPTVPGPKAGLEAAKAALLRLEAADPAARAALDRLRAAGRVVVVYDPSFPYPALSRVTLAAFLPTDPKAADGRRFVTIVGRYGAQRPRDELAAVLAHELVGHGLQHLEGRLGAGVRVLDMECEAMLATLAARRALGLREDGPDGIDLRRAVESRWCLDLRLWQADQAPETRALWEADRLDLGALLALFHRYQAAR